jgi:hypothetical protein
VTGVQTCALPIWRARGNKTKQMLRLTTHDSTGASNCGLSPPLFRNWCLQPREEQRLKVFVSSSCVFLGYFSVSRCFPKCGITKFVLLYGQRSSGSWHYIFWYANNRFGGVFRLHHHGWSVCIEKLARLCKRIARKMFIETQGRGLKTTLSLKRANVPHSSVSHLRLKTWRAS